MAEDPSDLSDIERSRKILTESETALSEALEALDLLKARMRDEETPPHAELSKTLTALSTHRGRVLDDMRKHEDRILLKEKRVAHAPLDFAELRVGIGRKLDRIRATLDAGRFSEGPDA